MFRYRKMMCTNLLESDAVNSPTVTFLTTGPLERRKLSIPSSGPVLGFVDRCLFHAGVELFCRARFYGAAVFFCRGRGEERTIRTRSERERKWADFGWRHLFIGKLGANAVRTEPFLPDQAAIL
jgi:hypothetical protein